MSLWHTIAKLNTTAMHSATHAAHSVINIVLAPSDYVLIAILGLVISIVSGVALVKLVKELSFVSEAPEKEFREEKYLD